MTKKLIFLLVVAIFAAVGAGNRVANRGAPAGATSGTNLRTYGDPGNYLADHVATLPPGITSITITSAGGFPAGTYTISLVSDSIDWGGGLTRIYYCSTGFGLGLTGGHWSTP